MSDARADEPPLEDGAFYWIVLDEGSRPEIAKFESVGVLGGLWWRPGEGLPPLGEHEPARVVKQARLRSAAHGDDLRRRRDSGRAASRFVRRLVAAHTERDFVKLAAIMQHAQAFIQERDEEVKS